jgi:hypothetical protein
VLSTVVLNDKDSAVPPTEPVPEAFAPAPPIPIIKPLFTILTVSPVAPPVNAKPGVPVEVEYRYIPEFIVMVMSDLPDTYPEMLDIVRAALAVVEAKVYDIAGLADWLPIVPITIKTELLLHTKHLYQF